MIGSGSHHEGDWAFNVRQQERVRRQAWGRPAGSGKGPRLRVRSPEIASAATLLGVGLCGYTACGIALKTHPRCRACGILVGPGGHWTERLVRGLCDGCRYAERRELWDDGVRL